MYKNPINKPCNQILNLGKADYLPAIGLEDIELDY
jgi:hypothetical protein